MLQIKYEDTFIPSRGRVQSRLESTASNGGYQGNGRSGVIRSTGESVTTGMRSIVEASHRLPVLDEVDVLVCGGGPAGSAAAIAAARSGAKR